MKIFIGLLLMINFASIPTDKVAHFGLSYVGNDVLRHAGLNDRDAAIGMFTIGLLKELTDSTFSGGDLAADVAGILLNNILNGNIEAKAQEWGEF